MIPPSDKQSAEDIEREVVYKKLKKLGMAKQMVSIEQSERNLQKIRNRIKAIDQKKEEVQLSHEKKVNEIKAEGQRRIMEATLQDLDQISSNKPEIPELDMQDAVEKATESNKVVNDQVEYLAD